MPGLALVLTFLKSNWKLIAIGVAIAAVMGYIGVLRVERNHYAAKAKSLEVLVSSLKTQAKLQEDSLKADAADLTRKYQNTLKDANTLVTVNARLNAENIKNAKELRDVKLSYNAIRLFNASKQADPNPAPQAVEGNAGNTSPASEASLQDLLTVVNSNDENHLKCINALEQWQKFWPDVEAAVNRANNANTR